MLLCLVMVAGSAACGGDATVEGKFKPKFLPIQFSWDSSNPNRIGISGELSRVTPIGIFSIGAKYTVPRADADSLLVVMRDRSEPPGFDHIYKVASGGGEFEAVVDGKTTIRIVNRQVLIDVTDSRVQKIEFRQAEASITESSSSIGEQWASYSTTSFYSPFGLTRWAYDDSTIDRWYGLGFVWFLVRLALAIVLMFVDIVLTFVFLVAGAAYLLFGTTGRNVVYGLSVLTTLWLVLIGLLDA